MPRKKQLEQAKLPQDVVEAQIVAAPKADSVFEDAPAPSPDLPAVRRDGLPALDSDLDEMQRAEFVKLLNSFMPVRERAVQLVKLAQFTDTKRAPVALRAIQEINDICRVKDKKDGDSPMFLLPNDTTVSVTVTKVEK